MKILFENWRKFILSESLTRSEIENAISNASFNSAQSSQHRWSPRQPIIDYNQYNGSWEFTATIPDGTNNADKWPSIGSKPGEDLQSFLNRVSDPIQMNLFENLLTEKLLLKDGPNGWQLYGKLVADAYDAAPEYDPKTAPAFAKLEPFIEKMYQRILSKVDIQFVEDDPYPDPNLMCDDVKSGVLKVFSGGTSHPIFSHENNLKFRALHDYMSHCQPSGWSGTGFDQKGEIQAYNAHLHTIPPSAAPALFTEVVGQASYYLHRGTFPKQKIAFLPGFDYFNLGVVEGYNIINKELVKL